MTTLFDFYNDNPVSIIDQNKWTDKDPAVVMRFQQGPSIYTPLVTWINRSQLTGAEFSQFSEMIEGDADVDPIGMADQYITDPLGVDSRMRQVTTARYGDKIQLVETSNIFQMWKMSGGRDWRPLLQGVLGSNVLRKFELLSRNAYLKGPKAHWTYAGNATDFAGINSNTKFDISIVNAWNLRLGQVGAPIIPGESASVKLAIMPPGVTYDFMTQIVSADSNETALWTSAKLYSGGNLQYEIGTYKNVRFIECPNDNYGQNASVLYNAGEIETQVAVTAIINMGDGAPDPEDVGGGIVDGVWYVGQKAVTHYIQLKSDTDMSKFAVNDMVSIGTVVTTAYGVATGNDPLSGRTIVRRIVKIDAGNHRISFDRPVMRAYKTTFNATLVGGAETGIYAIVTKAQHIGFVLVLGSKGGIVANVNRPMKFYEPVAVDDFQSVFRYVWDIIAGYNVWDPFLFECHFCAVSLPRPGGIIAPAAPLGS